MIYNISYIILLFDCLAGGGDGDGDDAAEATIYDVSFTRYI